MNRRYNINLVIIIILVGFCIWAVLPNNPGIHIGSFNRSMKTELGLDLRGGLQVLLEADLPEETEVDPQALQDARQIIENRSNALGVSEVVFQVAGARRIVGEFPGLTNTEEVIAVLKETGQLEFVDLGSTQMSEGTIIETDYGLTDQTSTKAEPTETPEATPAASTEETPDTESATEEPKVWHTIMTGDQLESVSVSRDQVGQYVINFKLKDAGAKIFADYTTNNVGKFLALVLDKKVISAPRVNSAITKGEGMIEGNFTLESANNLAIQLRYGSLPIPLKVVESKVIGPTLGQDSLNKSMIAGIIGLSLVILFMAIFYRLPGLLADVAIIIYALITLTLFKLIPVTLTLPGIAGLLLSTGSALDANILIFERLKEELRSGRTLGQAIELGWQRAWPSIRDSNVATIITCAILFWFGSSFGATIVKGFAVTLVLGVGVSLFTAIIVTRTFLNLVMRNVKIVNTAKWFGL
jgi:preprotein translocase subunit SecD